MEISFPKPQTLEHRGRERGRHTHFRTMLTDRIRLAGTTEDEPEDILSSCLGVIFPDDITHHHGDKDSSVIYLSPAFGPLELSVADPQAEDHRRLFSHFLWNAGLQLAEFIEDGWSTSNISGDGDKRAQESRRCEWDVKDQRVLEVGAGTGLAGLVSALKGAREVILSDYPAEEVLANLRANIERNVAAQAGKHPMAEIRVQGHEWGILDDEFSKAEKGGFGRILVADCLWMPWQHENLLRSISWFLAEGGRAWVVAGFHTGRQKMRGFFEEETVRAAGLEVERIWERNAEGFEWGWVTDRGAEDITSRKRWLAIAVLKHI
jgi:nicotinamide N-methyltransferase